MDYQEALSLHGLPSQFADVLKSAAPQAMRHAYSSPTRFQEMIQEHPEFFPGIEDAFVIWGTGNGDGYYAYLPETGIFVEHILEDGPSGERMIAAGLTEFGAYLLRQAVLSNRPQKELEELAGWLEFDLLQPLLAFIKSNPEDWEDPFDHSKDLLLQHIRAGR